ncbi:hypothetical protein DL96DRAFT_1594514 [Flagelloscypha sp. PMI_526]|nr:hypothetical protein DL96DRAFT_1594514 [Flagelloscypha sp. PMI_526]
MMDSEEDLAVLDHYGELFMAQFDMPTVTNAHKRKWNDQEKPSSNKRPKTDEDSSSDFEDEDEEEWGGIRAESSQEDIEEDGDEDDDFIASSQHNVVVFDDRPKPKPKESDERARRKTFMSSKVSKIGDNTIPNRAKKEPEEEFEQQNVQNDALLHRLVHTKLLSGALGDDLGMTPAEKRRATAGRVEELAGHTKLGQGEKSIRKAERNKAAKSVRDGLIAKQKQRHEQKVQEAKAVGNYHPAIKGMLSDHDEKRKAPKRVRGIGMGVGKFSKGTLKLSAKDIPGRSSTPQKSNRSRKGRK